MTGTNRTGVVDFPWKVRLNKGAIRNWSTDVRRMPYKMMTDKEVLAFDLDQFMAEESCLFVWTINSKIPVALQVLEANGYKYSSTIVWMKDNGITANGITTNCEYAIFGYRGRYPFSMGGRSIWTGFTAPRGRHSEKPAKFYEMIRSKTPEPRIDIFARRRHAGFDAWGDQVEDDVQEVLG